MSYSRDLFQVICHQIGRMDGFHLLDESQGVAHVIPVLGRIVGT